MRRKNVNSNLAGGVASPFHLYKSGKNIQQCLMSTFFLSNTF